VSVFETKKFLLQSPTEDHIKMIHGQDMLSPCAYCDIKNFLEILPFGSYTSFILVSLKRTAFKLNVYMEFLIKLFENNMTSIFTMKNNFFIKDDFYADSSFLRPTSIGNGFVGNILMKLF